MNGKRCRLRRQGRALMTASLRSAPRGLIAVLAYAALAGGIALCQFPVRGAEVADQVGASDPAALKADYLRKLADYQNARRQFEAVAQPYWNSIAQMRKSRNAKRRNAEVVGLADYVLD